MSDAILPVTNQRKTMSLNQQQITALLLQHFPQIQDEISIDSLTEHEAIVRLRVNNRHLRPGNTVSGPSMFLLADVAAYIAILAQVGARTQAVTTSAHIDFLRKPQAQADIIATTKVLKIGKQLAVTDVYLYSENDSNMVARAAMTYSLPPMNQA